MEVRLIVTGLPDWQIGISILAQALGELTANVNQLATVEVDVVAQGLANLTAVVSATALDIRTLSSQDIAHVPLPYNLVTIESEWGSSGTIASPGSAGITFTDSDWGVDQDFYPRFFLFEVADTSEFMEINFSGFKLQISEDPQVGSITSLFNKSYERAQVGLLKAGGSVYQVNITERLPGDKVLSDSDLNLFFTNRTGITLDKDQIFIIIGGVPITP